MNILLTVMCVLVMPEKIITFVASDVSEQSARQSSGTRIRSRQINFNNFTQMKKTILSLPIALLLGAAEAFAVPANPAPGQITQPDGSVITVRLHGDEFYNFLTTSDGYTLLRDADGIWRYAVKTDAGVLVPGPVAARNPAARNDSDRRYLASIGTMVTGVPSEAQTELRANAGSLARKSNDRGLYDYKKFKGLVLLVSYSDRAFSQNDIRQVFDDIINKPGFTGFTPAGQTSKQIYTGSVHDYFHDNSAGLFNPTFDVVGPVSVPYSQYEMEQTRNARAIINEACRRIDSEIDFSRYDTDGDGTVDMFYVIFAGYGSNNTGNDSRLVWPHASTMPGNVYDGVKLGRYACSTELYGTFYQSCIDGIGTICHEFSHVLGLMDEYDTDYSGSGGQSVDPGAWSVMAGGSYNNYARTPVGYSLMQRYQSGFAVPRTITEAGQWTLTDIDSSNTGYRINTSNSKEYFLLENRRKEGNKWNAYLPGQGMLIFRVDSTSTEPWTNNTINANPDHNYYELVRACPKGTGLAITDSDGDPFPGSGGITSVGPFSNPGLVSWRDRHSVGIQINDIAESEDGVITFSTARASGGDDCEDFENMTTNGSSDKNVQGKYCLWSFSKGGVYSPGEGLCNGTRAAGLLKGGTFETSAVDNVENVSMRLFNSASRNCNIRLQYYDKSIDGWVVLKDNSGQSGNTLDPKSATTLRFNIPDNIRPGLRLQLKVVTGSDTDRLYIDDVQMRGVNTEVAGVLDDSLSMLQAYVQPDGTLQVCTGADAVVLYDVSGRRIAYARISCGSALMRLPAHGTYILTDGRKHVKIAY